MLNRMEIKEFRNYQWQYNTIYLTQNNFFFFKPGLPDVGDLSGEDIPVFCRAEQFSHASYAGPFPNIS